MPITSEIVLAAIVVLGLTAIALLIAPTLGWIRRRASSDGKQHELRTEGALDPKAIARELVVRAATTTDDASDGLEPAPPLAQVVPDPTL